MGFIMRVDEFDVLVDPVGEGKCLQWSAVFPKGGQRVVIRNGWIYHHIDYQHINVRGIQAAVKDSIAAWREAAS